MEVIKDLEDKNAIWQLSKRGIAIPKITKKITEADLKGYRDTHITYRDT